MADMTKVLSLFIQASSDENLNAASAGQVVDPEQPTRKKALLDMAVEEAREAIRQGNRVALSTLVGSIPPELERFVLNTAAFQFVNSQPNLQMFVIGEGGVYAPLQKLFQEASEMLSAIRKGQIVSAPSEPEEGTGESGATGKIVGEVSMEVTV